MPTGLIRAVVLAVMASLSLAAPMASAEVFTQTQALPISAPPFTNAPSFAFTDWKYSSPAAGIPYGSFNQFDPTKGMLTAINITFSAQVQTDITMKFTTASTITVFVNQIVANLHLPNGAVLSVALPSISEADKETQTGTKQFVKSGQGSTSIVITDPGVLALFKGTGTFFLPIDATANTGASSDSGNGFGASQTQVGVTVTIQFVFIPEPSSFALVAIGGGCLLGAPHFRRRSKRIRTDALNGSR